MAQSPDDIRTALRERLGKRCVRTELVAMTPAAVAQALSIEMPAPVIRAVGGPAPAVSVRDLRAEKRALSAGSAKGKGTRRGRNGGEGTARGGASCPQVGSGAVERLKAAWDGHDDPARLAAGALPEQDAPAASGFRPVATAPAPALVTADISVCGPFTCPAVMAGADIALDALSTVPVTGPLCAVSLSRDAASVAGIATTLDALVEEAGASESLIAQASTAFAAAPGYDARSQHVNDNALAVAPYLECHPNVAAVAYPGLKTDPSHAVAASVLAHGFGPLVAFAPAGGEAAAAAVLNAWRSVAVAGDAVIKPSLRPLGGGSLLLSVGDGDTLALVMALEHVLAAAGE